MIDLVQLRLALQQPRYLLKEAQDGSGALIDLKGGHSAELNPSALFIASMLLDGSSSAVAIAEKISAAFSIDEESALVQVEECIGSLAALSRGQLDSPGIGSVEQ